MQEDPVELTAGGSSNVWVTRRLSLLARDEGVQTCTAARVEQHSLPFLHDHDCKQFLRHSDESMRIIIPRCDRCMRQVALCMGLKNSRSIIHWLCRNMQMSPCW
jgi:hypothetical protein